jgi:hypothetical protein
MRDSNWVPQPIFWRNEMPLSTNILDRLLADDPQSLLERILIAEYLLSNGYLMSELQTLPVQIARNLKTEACWFAALRLSEIEYRDVFQRKIRLPISLN